MEGESKPVIDIVGDTLKAPLPEASTASSWSDASSGGAASDVAKAKAEDARDLRKLPWSYDFGASLVTVGCIQQLESMRYFAKGSAHKPREETVLEPNNDEVVVFEEFFAVEL
jgi:hypothetical protein